MNYATFLPTGICYTASIAFPSVGVLQIIMGKACFFPIIAIITCERN